MEINFYQINDIIHKSIAPLLLKILEDGNKALIYSQDMELLKHIDDGLWSFSKTKFLPHGAIWENESAEKNPIFLTNLEENANKADFLIIFNKVENDFIKNFKKTFFFFNDKEINTARKLWVDYKNQSAKLGFYRKEVDKWVEINL